ncbi:hypothetical protein TSAR_002565 [Trichomalopsis sarcophagae]|uniref:Ionotropic glutamate receptor C-terminal domain-containing protein n=1 Tax=Trichomalopsis sarcophagae TaxID=543379 RepID=A0A232F292_9HYME|nr:hypothetical protein TSAR_002565 [Trichomalopsis sarcophagae]
MYPEMCFYYPENKEVYNIFKDVIAIPSISSGICAVALMNENTATHKFMLTFTKIVRMLLCMSNLRQPQRSDRRILFVVLIYLTIVLNSYFQSRLSAMHIVPNSDPTIDSREDMENSNLLVYGKQDYKEDCINKSPGMHVSNYVIKEIFEVMYTRRDWPLRFKFDKIIHYLHQAGIIQFHENMDNQVFAKHEPKHEQYSHLTIKRLGVAFYVLISGFVVDLRFGGGTSRFTNSDIDRE